MKYFNRDIRVFSLQEYFREDMRGGGSINQLFIDMKKNAIILAKSRLDGKDPERYKYLGEYNTKGKKVTIANVNAEASKALRAIREYDQHNLICQGKAISLFGKRAVTPSLLVKEVKNPYYSCAPSMRLYDKNALTYHQHSI